jgi:hypothetical protein
VGLLQEECVEWATNCSAARCCADPGLKCFEKDHTWASCIDDCVPGIHPEWDEPGHRTHWSCNVLKPTPKLGAGGAYEDDDDEAEAPGSCEDLLDGWQDDFNRSCRDYERGRLCTATGDFGQGWDGPGGLPVPGVAVMGHGLSAAEACCACGGGSTKSSVWSLVHRDWRCEDDGASMLTGKQAPDKMRLLDCQKFCFSYHHMEFRTSFPHAGVCQCHSECSADGQETHQGYHNLVFMRVTSQ